MADFNVVYWFLVVVSLASIQVESSAVYIFDNSSPRKVSFLNRVRRQTHPAATIAKLTSHDSSAFIPIVGPTQTQSSQQHTSFAGSNDFFPGNDFPSLQNVPNTLVDYLVPPSPDSPTTNLNFQDPAANLHSLQNNLDNFEITSSPTPSPSTNSNNFPNFHGNFQGASNFQSHVNNLQHLQTTPSTFINEQVQSVAFQNPSSVPSATPGFTQPASSSSPSLGGIGQTFSNKISNTGTLNRDGFTPINNNGNHFHTSQFSITTSAPSLPSLTKTDHEKAHQSPSAGKWELGFDANEILTPPREDLFGRVGEYDTINVNKFRRPSTNLNPPVANSDVQSNQNHLSSNQFLGSQNGIHHQFNQFSGSTSGSSHNDIFTPVTGNHNHFSSNKEQNTIEHGNVIWGSQKQPVSYNPTTSAPFLPTIPPSTPSSLHLSNFQNLNQPLSVSQNFHGNSFNSAPQQLQQLQFTQPPPPPREQYFEFGQNFPIETPLTSQFDTFLPQGTVADHTYQPYNENGRHFVKKRHWSGEDRPAELAPRKKLPNSGNVPEKYGKVVLSHDPKLFVQAATVNRENSRHVIKKRQWNGDDETSGAVADEIRLRNIESLFRRALEMNREAGRKKRQKNEENSYNDSPTEVIIGKKNKSQGLKKKHPAIDHEEREEDIPVIFKKSLASSGTERSGGKEHDVKRRQWNGEDEVEEHDEDESLQSNHNPSPFGVKRPVYSFVKTDREGNFKWSVRHASKR